MVSPTVGKYRLQVATVLPLPLVPAVVTEASTGSDFIVPNSALAMVEFSLSNFAPELCHPGLLGDGGVLVLVGGEG